MGTNQVARCEYYKFEVFLSEKCKFFTGHCRVVYAEDQVVVEQASWDQHLEH